jgi:trans-2-enoyl-CoA reductase
MLGLRSIESPVPFRDFRVPQASASTPESLVEKYSSDDIDDNDEKVGLTGPLDDAAHRDVSTQPINDNSTIVGGGDSAEFWLNEHPEASMLDPIIHYIGFAYVGPPREDFQLSSKIINMPPESTGAGREMRSDVALQLYRSDRL